MSANTNISEGGKARPFGPVKALMVQGENGKYYSWYPESEKALGTLSVDKNGVYRASDKGVYGWSSVYVNVSTSDSVTGRDPDTGEEVVVRPDPETGEITETVVPVEIRVIEPPTNPYGVYVDGQTITKDGMVVKAYSANGDEMQVVPISEITINPTTAIFDESKDTGGYDEATIDDASVLYDPDAITQPVTAISQIVETTYNPKQTITYTPYGNSYLFLLDNELRTIPTAIITTNGSGYRERCVNETTPSRSYDVTRTTSISNDTRVSHTPYGYIQGASNSKSNPDRIRTGITTKITGYGGNESIRDLATIILDGSVTHIPAGSPQTINVSWPRPGDGAILETTFDILVGPHGGGPTGED